MLNPSYPPYLMVALIIFLIVFLLYRYLWLYQNLEKKRLAAAQHHDWKTVLDLGRRQLAIRRGGLDLSHDMAVALRKTGHNEEAYSFALRVQRLLTVEQAGVVTLIAGDDGDVHAFQGASLRYLRSMEVIGLTALDQGRLAEAREIFAYLVGIGGKFFHCHTPLAFALIGLGEADTAAEYLQNFLAEAPVKAVKEVRAHLADWVMLAPDSPDLRAFQAKFFQLEGRVEEEYSRLFTMLREDSLKGGALILLAELALLAGDGPREELAAEFNRKSSFLLNNDLNRTPLLTASRRCQARRAEMQACFKTAKEIDHTRGSVTSFTSCFERIPRLVEEGAALDPGLASEGAGYLLRLGAATRALDLLQCFPAMNEGEREEWQERHREVRSVAMHQQMTESARMLAGRSESSLLIADSRFGPLRLIPGDRYRRFLSGEALNSEERFAEMYRITTAILYLKQPRDEAIGLLQAVAMSTSEYRNAAILRLALILTEEGDPKTALHYLDRLTSFEQAVRTTPGEALADAYALALALETRHPERASELYRHITLTDLDYREARVRGEALASGRPLPAEGTELCDLFTQTRVGAPLKPSRAADGLPAAGDLVDGRYRLEEIIGQGGMGMVYKAEDIRLNRTVAIKMVRPGLDKTLTQVEERFTLEAQLAGKLLHERGIVTVLDIGRNPSTYIVMEYVDGLSLRELCDLRPLTAGEMVTLLHQTAVTLASAHRAGILHRDIKPSNILLENGLANRTKIADFGLAKAMEESERRLTLTGAVIGTKTYMSPEQMKGQTLDGRSDLYAWSCMAYELCSGNPPFTAGDLAYQHVHEPPEPLSGRCRIPGLPRAFFELVMQGLAKSVKDRPASMEVVASRLATLFPELLSGYSPGQLPVAALPENP